MNTNKKTNTNEDTKLTGCIPNLSPDPLFIWPFYDLVLVFIPFTILFFIWVCYSLVVLSIIGATGVVVNDVEGIAGGGDMGYFYWFYSEFLTWTDITRGLGHLNFYCPRKGIFDFFLSRIRQGCWAPGAPGKNPREKEPRPSGPPDWGPDPSGAPDLGARAPVGPQT